MSILLVISLSIAFSSRIGYFTMPNSITYSIMLFWVAVALYRKLSVSKKDRYVSVISSVFISDNFSITLFIYLYTMLLIAFELTESRFLSTNIQSFINAVSAVSIFYLFKKDAFKYSVISLAITYLIAITGSLASGSAFFEFHDLAFGSGFLVIYYFMCKDRLYRKDVKWVILILIITLLAFKRIEIGALVVVVFLHFLLNLISESKQRIVLIASSCALVIGIYMYIIICSNRAITTFFSSLGLDMMGRQYYYTIFNNYASLTPSFLGIGRNAMAVLFTHEYSYMNVGNIHSDILRMYAECGFYVFPLWLYIYLYHFPKKIDKALGFRTMKVFALCTFYLFITYFTDNTELYLVTRYFYILVPIQIAYEEYLNGKLDLNRATKALHKRRMRIRLR